MTETRGLNTSKPEFMGLDRLDHLDQAEAAAAAGGDQPERRLGPGNGLVAKVKQAKPRKRTTRACDQCNHLRTKCDGMQPCSHCLEAELECEYLRVPQKRGKTAQGQAKRKKEDRSGSFSTGLQDVHDTNGAGNGIGNSNGSGSANGTGPGDNTIASANGGHSHNGAYSGPLSGPHSGPHTGTGPGPGSGSSHLPHSASTHTITTAPPTQPSVGSISAVGTGKRTSEPLPSYGHYAGYPAVSPLSVDPLGDYQIKSLHSSHHSHPTTNSESSINPITAGPDSAASSLDLNNYRRTGSTPQGLVFTPLLGQSPGMFASAQSPGSVSAILNSLEYNGNGTGSAPGNGTEMYPGSLSMLLNDEKPAENGVSAPKPPRNGAITGPGVSSGATGASTSTSNGTSAANTGSALTTDPGGLRYPVLTPIIDKLAAADISLALAQDLLETYFDHSTHVLAYLVRKSSVMAADQSYRKTEPSLLFAMLTVAAHSSDNVALTRAPAARLHIIDTLTSLTTAHLHTTTRTTEQGSLDEVISYIQLGTLVSASEFKGTSLRWWAAGWELAKELKLNHEFAECDAELREERRRTWWLLYVVDRHLGLCYNRPLAILDAACMDLFLPVDEAIWESSVPLTPPELDPSRERGISCIVRGQGIYGYFLPLMSILGTLLQIHHAEQNPMLPQSDVSQRATVRSYLEQYMTSLKNWTGVSASQSHGNAWRDYATQLAHVMYILSMVSWDPTELLQSSDSLLANPEYPAISGHAIAAAKSIRRILAIDPDMTLMPFFFGIYLLQGSFVLLAIVDRMEAEAPQEVVAACETVVHAHEVCIVTLNTEYQRNFRRVMRGTMSLIANTSADKQTPSSISSISSQSPNPMHWGSDGGSLPEMSRGEKEEARRRRQDVLGLYRWTPGGHGLAV